MGMFDLIAPFYNHTMRAGGITYARAAHVLSPAEGDLVLDVGGGTGLGALAVTDLVSCRAVVLDPSEAMLRHPAARGRFARVRADGVNIPVPDAIADGALILDALHHFRRPLAALQEVRRVLRPGGRLVIAELDATRTPVRLLGWGERRLGEPGTLWTPGQLTNLVDTAGLRTSDLQLDGVMIYLLAVGDDLVGAQNRDDEPET